MDKSFIENTRQQAAKMSDDGTKLERLLDEWIEEIAKRCQEVECSASVLTGYQKNWLRKMTARHDVLVEIRGRI